MVNSSSSSHPNEKQSEQPDGQATDEPPHLGGRDVSRRLSNPKSTLSAQSRQTRRRMRRAAADTTYYTSRRAHTAPPSPRVPHGVPDNPLDAQLTQSQSASFANLTFNNAFTGLLQPAHKINVVPTWKESLFNTVRYSYMNLLLVFIPVSWALHFTGQSATVVFVFSFISIIPLAALLGFATEELSFYVGSTLSGLANATFGNAVELIIAILALVKGELAVVQSSMLGSILSNCLLVLGMCFLAGGIRFHEQGYGIRAQQLNISLLSISVFSIVIPAAFHSSLNIAGSTGTSPQETSGESNAVSTRHILMISRGTSIILLFVYAAYLVFQLWTHAYLYTAQASAHHAAITHDHGIGTDGPSAPRGPVFRMPNLPSLPSMPSVLRRHSTMTSHSRRSSSSSSSNSSSSTSITPSQLEAAEARLRIKETLGLETEEHSPKLRLPATIVLLAVVTVITGITAEWLVDSIPGLVSGGVVSREFVALILLPLVGNAAEHVTAVTVSVRNRLDLAMTVAVGSSIQIALFVLPFLVLLGWIIGQPLSLFFDVFETIVVFVSVLIVNYAISDGRTNWLEGLILMVVYVIIGVSVWFYPGTGPSEI